MYPIGVTSYAFEHTSERFAKLRASGLEAVELCLSNNPSIDFPAFRHMAQDSDVRIWSCHLPFRPTNEMDLSLSDPALRQKALSRLSDIILRGSDIGIDKFVLHPSLPLPPSADRAERKRCSVEMLGTLADLAYQNGAMIAVENMTPACLGNCSEELLELLQANDKLRICFDINHLLLESHEQFLEKLHNKLITVHLSDYDFITERHAFPGKGKINWPQLASLLQQYGYRGVWMYELGLSETTEEDGDGGHTFTELSRASQQIFAGQNPH